MGKAEAIVALELWRPAGEFCTFERCPQPQATLTRRRSHSRINLFVTCEKLKLSSLSANRIATSLKNPIFWCDHKEIRRYQT